MAYTMAIFFVFLGVLLAFPGLWLLCSGLWPQNIARAGEVCARGLIKPFLVGLPITSAMIFAAAILNNAGTAGKNTAGPARRAHLFVLHHRAAGLLTLCV